MNHQSQLDESHVLIGHVVGFHGLRGDVKVRTTSENPDWVKNLKSLVMRHEGKQTELRIARARQKSPNLVVMAFEGYTDRTQVERDLARGELYALQEALPEPDTEAGEFWMDDLVGLDVYEESTGRQMGVIKDLLSAAGKDYLELQLPEQKKTVLIPFIDEFFPDVNVEENRITVARLGEFLEAEMASGSDGQG